jgi:hypothetical protein
LCQKTELQRQGLSLQQVQSVTGHLTEEMTERYSHLDARQIASVTEAQSVISGEKPNLKIVKMPETENIRKRLVSGVVVFKDGFVISHTQTPAFPLQKS